MTDETISKSKDVLFFTAANQPYEDFIPLYAYAVLSHVQSAKLEFAVEDADRFSKDNAAALSIIERDFGPGRVIIRNTEWVGADGKNIIPNTVRFITTPKTTSTYVYIGDIDIIVLEPDLVDVHLDHMKRTGLPFSNSVRPNTTRMTGLHFSRTDAYYPLPDFSDLNLGKMNDEMVLYEIVRRKVGDIPDGEWFRPIHGIHVSPNRPPMGSYDADGKMITPDWGISPQVKRWLSFRKRLETSGIVPKMSERIQSVIATIDEITQSEEKLRQLDNAAGWSTATFNGDEELKSTGHWVGAIYPLDKPDTNSVIRFRLEPRAESAFEAHVLVRSASDPTRYRWFAPFHGRLESSQDFEVSVTSLSDVGGASLADCDQMIIRIRAMDVAAAAVNVSNVSFTAPSH